MVESGSKIYLTLGLISSPNIQANEQNISIVSVLSSLIATPSPQAGVWSCRYENMDVNGNKYIVLYCKFIYNLYFILGIYLLDDCS